MEGTIPSATQTPPRAPDESCSAHGHEEEDGPGHRRRGYGSHLDRDGDGVGCE
ncbi:excalibur calcium-binding domain-containing protein [Streptomyces sp. GMY02]|uniref:excalibur calcium-binding domain-containing protein n=1 Tax=Streptomyces sp. GMY02 TaxID=1333528 RepID=UPI001C2C93C7|nr:excalibur calcium-binding domain-containing protein [Streptomyces sp. GMY02]